MTESQLWWKGYRRYAGLAIMGLGLIAVIVIGALAFARLVTVETASSALAFSVLLIGLPGFVLHIVTIIRTRNRDRA